MRVCVQGSFCSHSFTHSNPSSLSLPLSLVLEEIGVGQLSAEPIINCEYGNYFAVEVNEPGRLNGTLGHMNAVHLQE